MGADELILTFFHLVVRMCTPATDWSRAKRNRPPGAGRRAPGPSDRGVGAPHSPVTPRVVRILLVGLDRPEATGATTVLLVVPLLHWHNNTQAKSESSQAWSLASRENVHSGQARAVNLPALSSPRMTRAAT